jgi:phosphohistidine phosphatase
MAAHLTAAGIAPELVICSPAKRARETLDALAGALGEAEVEIDRHVYEATEADLLERVRKISSVVASAMVIGHNPAIQRLALLLAADTAELDELREKFPTAALATLTFDGPDWSELKAKEAELADFTRPRDLERS